MTERTSQDVDRLISIGLDAIGSFDERDLDATYEQEDTGAERYSMADSVSEPVPNEHYLG